MTSSLPSDNPITRSITYPPKAMMPHPQCIILLRSFANDVSHRISLDAKTCDCPGFQQTPGRCEHLNALGIYQLKSFQAKTHPTFSQALSALVKSLRIRRTEDAVYWLLYLDTFKEPQYRFRTARRLLIGSAEDGHSIAVMERVAEHFSVISRAQTELYYLAAEVLRICKVPNWWHPCTGGPDYIHSGMVGRRELAYFPGERSKESISALIEQGIEHQQKSMALAGVMGLSDARVGATKQAELVLALAKRYQHPLAERLAQIHLHAKSALSSDNNFLCQAAWIMAGGVSPVADEEEPIQEAEVQALIIQAEERWRHPQPIPGWCCDGTHSAGNDVRFAGMWHHMHAVCKAFEHFGRIDPEDQWLPEFQCYDGLRIDTTR